MRPASILGLFTAVLSASAVQAANATTSGPSTASLGASSGNTSVKSTGILGLPLTQTVIANTPPACILACACSTNCTIPGDFACQCGTGSNAMQSCLAKKCNDDVAVGLAYFQSRCNISGHAIQLNANATAALARAVNANATANSTAVLRAGAQGNANISTSNIVPSNNTILNSTARQTPARTSDAAAQLATLPRGELVAIVVLASMYFFTM